MTAFPKLGAIWVYLAASPLLGLTITLIAYLFAQAVYARARFNPLPNPVLIALALCENDFARVWPRRSRRSAPRST